MLSENQKPISQRMRKFYFPYIPYVFIFNRMSIKVIGRHVTECTCIHAHVLNITFSLYTHIAIVRYA